MSRNLHPYPAYKDSGVPWLGEVPAHWNTGRLKNRVANIVEQTDSGATDDIYIALEHVESWTGRIRAPKESVSFESQVKRFRPNDVLFGKLRPYLAKVARPSVPGVCVGEFFVLRPNAADVKPEFLAYLLRAKPIIDVVNSSTYGAKMPRANWNFVGNLLLNFPPTAEQHAITRFLDHNDRRINRYIRAKRRLIALLNEQKQAIIHRAVTRGLDPHVPLKPSGVEWFSELPEHWQVLPLSRVLAERKEKNNPIKTTNILSLSLSAGVIPYADKKPGGNKAKEDLSAYMLAYPGDIVLNSMNVVVGSVGLSKYFGAVSPVYYVLYPRQAVDSVKYFDAIFQSPIFQRSLFGLGNGIMYIESKSSGKLNTIRLRIPMGKLNRVQIPYPTPDEQVRIVEYLNQATGSFNSAIDRAERQVALIQEYRTRLIADVVTGKLDVRGVALPEEGEADAGELIDEDLDEQGLDGEGEELDAWEDVEDGDD